MKQSERSLKEDATRHVTSETARTTKKDAKNVSERMKHSLIVASKEIFVFIVKTRKMNQNDLHNKSEKKNNSFDTHYKLHESDQSLDD